MKLFDGDQYKRYYTISEVADRFGVSKSLIRYWEKEFDILTPYKNSKGDRRFTRQNIDQIQLIYSLLKERGFTLKGAKKEIELRQNYHARRLETIETLEGFRHFLLQLKDKL
jgi:DNA-binding transcriptional MerR regulator